MPRHFDRLQRIKSELNELTKAPLYAKSTKAERIIADAIGLLDEMALELHQVDVRLGALEQVIRFSPE